MDNSVFQLVTAVGVRMLHGVETKGAGVCFLCHKRGWGVYRIGAFSRRAVICNLYKLDYCLEGTGEYCIFVL